MDKEKLLKQLLGQIEKQLATMQQAARASHDAATGSEAKAEGKYDTRGLEASYLASAQIEQCEKLSKAIDTLNAFTFPTLEPDPSAKAGNIVEVESNGNLQYYFLLPCGGGMTLIHEDGDITTLTPEAPLYQAILGNKAGSLIGDGHSLILEVI